MGSIAIENIKFTYEDYLHMPEDKRYELIEGEFYMVPSPDTFHQYISENIGEVLKRFVKERGLGEIFRAPLDVVFSEGDVVQPDILFISKERRHIITRENIKGAPDLVIEIISKSSEYRDRVMKRKLYAKFGVKEYWLVDPEAKTIDVFNFQKGYEASMVFTIKEELISPNLEGLKIPLKRVFEGEDEI